MQKKFDEGDIKKAIGAIRAKVPEAGDCHAEILSRFRGTTRVQCDGQFWVVDIVHGMIEKETK